MTVRSVARAVVAASLVALLGAPLASAHVTLNPREWEAGGFARFAFRVPNERPDASTTKIVVQFPENVSSASFQPVEGWTRTIQMIALDTPLTDEDGNEITERIDTVTWEGGEIKPGEFQEFGVSFQVPDTPGEQIAFPAVQTYSSGETVRWIGDEDADEPAPAITVLAAAGEEEAAPPDTTASEPTDTTATAVDAESASNTDDDDDDSRATLALVLAVLGLAAGLGALALVFARGRGRGTTG